MSVDSKVLIQLQADTKDINAKLASLGDVLASISTHTKNLEGIGKTTWAAYTTGINQAFEVAQKVIGVLRDVAKVMLDVANAAGHQEAAEIKLEAALRAHGVTVPGVVSALANQASALQKLTGENDEAILGVQAMLVAMGVMPSKLDAATRAALDISRVFGKDLQGSALMVAQAMEGNTRGIVKLIPALKGMEKGALDADGVLRKLNEAMGGLSEKEGETYLAQLRKLDSAWGDLKETLGMYVIPVLREIIDLTMRGIHAIEGLLGVETLAWKKRELDILEKAIAQAEERERRYNAMTDRQKAILDASDPYGLSHTVYKGMNLEQARARAEELRRMIAAETKADQQTIQAADKQFQKERSHALDELLKKWKEGLPKLRIDVEFAGAPGGGGYFRELAEAEAERLKLREQYKQILNVTLPGEKQTVGEIIDQVAAAKKLNIEKKAYLEFTKAALDVDQQLRERSQMFFDMAKKRGEAEVATAREVLDLRRQELSISKEDYIRGQIEQYERLIALEEERYELLDKSLMTERQQIEAEEEKNRKVEQYRNRIRGLQIDMKARTGTGDEGFTRGIQEWLDSQKTVFEQMRDLAKETAQGMADTFGTMFFDMFEGRLKSLGEYVKDFARNVLRQISQILGQMVAQQIIKGSLGFLPSFSYHEGGRGIAEASGFRLVPAEAFASARRYHAGLTPDEVPLIAQRREMPFIFTPEQMKAMAGMFQRSMSISIPITVDDQSRGRRLKRVVERAVSKEIGGWL
ncbi:MAG: Lambda phage tail tape-measure protein (Tape_meas_lam_C) [Syntrophaceae bacterium PtaU1.Bin231]|nr:MAG: Lambda phage tail tape-measure protein (Tape_meas_lam_C) [Syntrophaceae bacterium PtaU1.Bin231]